jgi:hypothetical protein
MARVAWGERWPRNGWDIEYTELGGTDALTGPTTTGGLLIVSL